MDLYKAIAQMRKLTSEGKTFSFSFMSFNSDTNESEGIKEISNAKLRTAAKNDDVKNSDYKLFYYDCDAKLPRVCWQPLLMSFNGVQLNLN